MLTAGDTFAMLLLRIFFFSFLTDRDWHRSWDGNTRDKLEDNGIDTFFEGLTL